MGPDVTPTAAATRLPDCPSLDGTRAIALAAVLVYHHEAAWAPGGFLAVSLALFFTRSGLLITSLVVTEHRATGRVSLPAVARSRSPARATSWLPAA